MPPSAPRKPRPRVLVLDEWVPHPPDSGKKIRTFQLLRHLSDEFEIDLLSHRRAAPATAVSHMSEVGVHVETAPGGVPRKGGIAFPARVAASLASKLPYSVWSHLRRSYARVVRRLLRSHAYDLVHCEWTPYFSYTRGAEVPVVVGTHNIEAQIWARHAEHASRPAMRRFLQVQARRMEAYERGVFSRIAAATACTEADAETIRAWGGKDVVVVPNGVDTGHFIPGPADEVERDTLVFTASMDSRPNQDAVVWFLDEVLPRLSDTPVRFVVVGRAPPAWLVQRAASLDGVEVTGAVDDVAPFLARAGIVVVPLRIGGGSRLKILEAAAAERPVVSTTVGAEGLGFADGEHLLLADTPEAFADAVRRLRGDEALGSSLARAARAEALRRYDWGAIADIQAAFWKRVAGRAASVS